jgi:hypothetical protein
MVLALDKNTLAAVVVVLARLAETTLIAQLVVLAVLV